MAVLHVVRGTVFFSHIPFSVVLSSLILKSRSPLKLQGALRERTSPELRGLFGDLWAPGFSMIKRAFGPVWGMTALRFSLRTLLAPRYFGQGTRPYMADGMNSTALECTLKLLPCLKARCTLSNCSKGGVQSPLCPLNHPMEPEAYR